MIYLRIKLLAPTSDLIFMFISSRFITTNCQRLHASLTVQLSGSGTNFGTITCDDLPQNNYTSFENPKIDVTNT